MEPHATIKLPDKQETDILALVIPIVNEEESADAMDAGREKTR